MTMNSSASDDAAVPSDLEKLLPASGSRTLDDYLAMQAAIGDRTRFLVVYTLATDGPHTPGQLADHVDVRANTLHYHLNKLSDVGLVETGQHARSAADAQHTYYELTPAGRKILDHGVLELIRRDGTPTGDS
ncbi:winged helix-turn-helix domain-containing protein [Halogeometricum limi]|uniref:Helix-turn-helix domain-containing protein n=1 Tax=Halogeometricum limi TaxID=555875 RepID=A0A1I6I972_9EURY|nr:winged helix-turn-helix domain-containing protein [Halogeometricum limi]SFR63209.1 Helix-turn-helix domain-containing protein [Halogeometricum limi]